MGIPGACDCSEGDRLKSVPPTSYFSEFDESKAIKVTWRGVSFKGPKVKAIDWAFVVSEAPARILQRACNLMKAK
jgi:hypothetical protein